MPDKTAGPGAITFANPDGVGANDEIIDVPAAKTKDGKTPTPEELAAMSAEATLARLGVNPASDEIVDLPGREEYDELVKAIGGPENVPAAAEDLRQVAGLFDIVGEIENADSEGIVAALGTWREILASPEAAQAVLSAIYDPANRDKEPVRSYFKGTASASVNEAIARLWQAAHGEAPVGRAKPRGDGFEK